MWYKVHDLSWFLCRIWDKVVCGSSKILVFVAVGLLMVYRHPLLMEKSAQGVNMFFSKVCCLSFVTQKHWSNRSRRTNEALIRFKLQAGFDLVTFFFWSVPHNHARPRGRVFLASTKNRDLWASGLVQHRKSAIHGLPVTSDKSGWLRIRNANSAHTQKVGLGKRCRSWCWSIGARPQGMRMHP